MVDITFIAAAMSSLKAAKDIGESMIGLRDAQAFQQKRLEFQSAIIDAQNAALHANDERATLVQAVAELKEKISKLKTWQTQKERYELKDVEGSGTFAYGLKEQMQGPDPMHYICPNCYEEAKKRVLQTETRFPGRAEVLVCHECSLELFFRGSREPNQPSLRGRPR